MLATVECRHDRGIESDGGRVISAPGRGERWWCSRIARKRKQAAPGPIGCDVKSWQLSFRSLVTVATDIGVNQPGIPGRNVLVGQLQTLAYARGKVRSEE